MELQRLAIIVGRMCRFMFMTRWLRPGAKASLYFGFGTRRNTDRKRETPRAWGGGVIRGGGGRTNIYWR